MGFYDSGFLELDLPCVSIRDLHVVACMSIVLGFFLSFCAVPFTFIWPDNVASCV